MKPVPFLSVLESPTTALSLSECQKDRVTLHNDTALLSSGESK